MACLPRQRAVGRQITQHIMCIRPVDVFAYICGCQSCHIAWISFATFTWLDVTCPETCKWQTSILASACAVASADAGIPNDKDVARQRSHQRPTKQLRPSCVARIKRSGFGSFACEVFNKIFQQRQWTVRKAHAGRLPHLAASCVGWTRLGLPGRVAGHDSKKKRPFSR